MSCSVLFGVFIGKKHYIVCCYATVRTAVDDVIVFAPGAVATTRYWTPFKPVELAIGRVGVLTVV